MGHNFYKYPSRTRCAFSFASFIISGLGEWGVVQVFGRYVAWKLNKNATKLVEVSFNDDRSPIQNNKQKLCAKGNSVLLQSILKQFACIKYWRWRREFFAMQCCQPHRLHDCKSYQTAPLKISMTVAWRYTPAINDYLRQLQKIWFLPGLAKNYSCFWMEFNFNSITDYR